MSRRFRGLHHRRATGSWRTTRSVCAGRPRLGTQRTARLGEVRLRLRGGTASKSIPLELATLRLATDDPGALIWTQPGRSSGAQFGVSERNASRQARRMSCVVSPASQPEIHLRRDPARPHRRLSPRWRRRGSPGFTRQPTPKTAFIVAAVATAALPSINLARPCWARFWMTRYARPSAEDLGQEDCLTSEGRILAIRWLTRCSLGVGLERERLWTR